jgi:hypothetical protein
MTKWILGTSLALTCLAAPVFGQPFSTDLYSHASYAGRVETLENELTRVQAELASYQVRNDHPANFASNRHFGNSSWTFGAEAAALKPFVGLPDGEEFNYEATPRVWMGYEGASGLGTKFTYWQFDGTNRSGLLELEALSLDWDVSQRGRFQHWDIVVFGGLRYGKLGTDLLTTFEGIGPTVGAEVRRPFGDRGVAFVGNARGSILFDDSFSDPLGGSLRDGSMTVWQVQLGVEWSRPIFWSNSLVVRALYESQQWEGPTLLGLLAPSVSFGGPTISVGISR